MFECHWRKMAKIQSAVGHRTVSLVSFESLRCPPRSVSPARLGFVGVFALHVLTPCGIPLRLLCFVWRAWVKQGFKVASRLL